MTLKKLPLGIQDFATIVENNYLYVDKTQLIYKLIMEGKPYFLSRPRRFGKSLLISTIAAIFQNQRHLFKDLWINQSDYLWQEHPVIRLDMSRLPTDSIKSMNDRLIELLVEIARKNNISLSINENSLAMIVFDDLISKLSSINPVVILIDEYDKPLLNKLSNPEDAKEIRDFLRDFYTIIKSQDENLKFILLTGVSKFSKVSVFSGINNLLDITMTKDYGGLLGYTENEIHANFNNYIKSVSQELNMPEATILTELKKWYNGYLFSSRSERVYNPFSVLSLLASKDFRTYWFETGTPTFLVELLQKNSLDIPSLRALHVKENAFSSYDIENLDVLPLLYQAGYLTLKNYDPITRFYTLGYPNFEVENSFLEILMAAKLNISKANQNTFIFELSNALNDKNWNSFFDTLKRLFALIPYNLHTSNEKYYQTIFYLTFTLLGQAINAEVHTNNGRIDAVIKHQNIIYIFEFKLDKSAKAAIEQINEKKYELAFKSNVTQIFKIGINFSTKLKNIDDWLILD